MLLNSQELYIYRDEASSLLSPNQPLKRYSLAELNVSSGHTNTSLKLKYASAGKSLACFRSGVGVRMEEFVATRLWEAKLLETITNSKGKGKKTLLH